MIDARLDSPEQIRAAYDRRSAAYAQAGLVDVGRRFLPGRFPSEVVVARKPSSEPAEAA